MTAERRKSSLGNTSFATAKEIKDIVFEKKGFLGSLDLFGHTINLNFEKAGPKHKTRLGGTCSIFIWIFMIVFWAVQIKKLVLKEDNYETLKIGLFDINGKTID